MHAQDRGRLMTRLYEWDVGSAEVGTPISAQVWIRSEWAHSTFEICLTRHLYSPSEILAGAGQRRSRVRPERLLDSA